MTSAINRARRGARVRSPPAPYVATQHLLLALGQLDDRATQLALARLGIKPARLRDNTLAAIRPA